MEDIQIKVDQLFAEFDHTVTPGCALAVVKDGEIIYKRGYGMANLEYGIPITPATIFHIASVSKHFAALAVTLLAHESKLSLDDEVRKYVTELPDFGEKITIKHLLYHTSGIRDQWELLIAAGWRMDDVITMDDILELLSKQRELNFKPGDNHTYCNLGYTLVSFIVQRVTGKSMREFCEERLFKPLGMQSTHFHDDHQMVVPNRAYSYSSAGYNLYKNAVLNYANVGATSLFTTVEDMALWDREFYEGKVFGKAVIDEMHTLGKLNNGEELEYAYGLRIANYRGQRIAEHSGGDAGYRTHLVRFPDQHFSVIVFSNYGMASATELAYKVADLYLADVLTAQPVEQIIELSKEEWAQFAGLYYSKKEQAVYRFEMRDDKLLVAMDRGFELEATAKYSFRLKQHPKMKMNLIQENGSNNWKVQVPMSYGHMEEYEKAVPATPGKVELQAYEGVYFCPELEVKYTLLVDGDKLHLKRRKYGSKPLEPTIKDDFTYMEDMAYLHFTHNDKGDVDGFKMTTGRVKNLRFVKEV